MSESRNFKELEQLLNDCQVECPIVGGYTMMRYSEPRFTKDLDIWVGHASVNARGVFAALARFGAPLHHDGVTEETFSSEHIVYQIGVAPVSLPDRIANKRAAGRSGDLEHLGLLGAE